MNMTSRRLEHIVGISIALISLVVYIATLCPTVNFIDSGELATDVFTLGIAHPTGYPLFTLIGYVVSHIPLGFRVIYQLNLMAAVLCAAAACFFFRFILLLVDFLSNRSEKERMSQDGPVTKSDVITRFIPAAYGTLVLCFSETFWSQALSIEVYSLHVLFLALLLLLFTKALQCNMLPDRQKSERRGRNRYWFCFAFVLGLSFANHGTTILLAPALLVAYFYLFGINSHSLKSIVMLAVPFILGLSVVLYLPLRASASPVMNWGDPDTFERFLWHVRGRQYTVWLFESWDTAAKQFRYFAETLPGKFAYLPLVMGGIGVWHLFKSHRMLFVFTLLLFGGCIVYAINYDIHDIDSYFLLAYVAVAVWGGVGARVVLTSKSVSSAVTLISSLLIISTGYLIVHNLDDVSESRTYIVEDYTKDLFRSVQSNSIIFSYQWDYFVSASLYLQLVERERPDLVIIDKELLRRTWYLELLQQRFPEVIGKSKPELDAYARELSKFEHDLPYNPNVIEYHYTNFIRSIIDRNYGSRHIYVTQEIEPRYTGTYERTPSGLAFQLHADTAYHPVAMPDFQIRVPSRTDLYVDGIVSMYARAYYNNAVYASQHGNREGAVALLDRSLEIKPDFEEARAFRGRMQP